MESPYNIPSNTPLEEWVKDSNEDYRTYPSQVDSFVRNTLNEDENLRTTHRVNNGKNHITRAMQADNTPQKPETHFANANRSGYSSWLNNRALKSISKSSNLYADESPYLERNQCGSCRRWK